MASRFGTSADMIVQTVEENGHEYLLAINEKGLYLTRQSFLDSNFADPNRFSESRKDVKKRLSLLNLDFEALLAANQHKVSKVGEGEVKKKVNPLKASKRSMKG